MSDQLLYICINFAVISIPFLLSFDKKVAFYKEWKFLFPSILLVGSVFIAWDMWFTAAGYWGFNERYHSSIKLFNLPLGEVLFFITVPYACVFIYDSLKAYFADFISKTKFQYILYLVILFATVLFMLNFAKPYSSTALPLSVLIALVLLRTQPDYLDALMFAYLVSIVPFLLVNGILTGSLIEEEIVWYNTAVFSNFRLLTIPVEDLFYSFDMIVLVIVLKEYFFKNYRFKKII